MLSGSHESQEYQDFLISEARRGLIPPDLYNALLPNFQDNMVLLDFGCGLGYTSGFYAEKFKDEKEFHIFACDYQVEVLDSFWRRIVENKLKNITPFFMPNRSRLHFPKWIMPADHIFLSLSLSVTENPVDILTTIKPVLKEGGLVHIIGWDKEKTHPLLENLFPESDRLSIGQVEQYLNIARYNIIRHYKTSGPFFALTVTPRPEQESGYSTEKDSPVAAQAEGPSKSESKPREEPLPLPDDDKMDEFLPVPPDSTEEGS